MPSLLSLGAHGVLGHPLRQKLKGVATVAVPLLVALGLRARRLEQWLDLTLLPLDASVGGATKELASDEDLGEGDDPGVLLHARADDVALVVGRVLERVEVELLVADAERIEELEGRPGWGRTGGGYRKGAAREGRDGGRGEGEGAASRRSGGGGGGAAHQQNSHDSMATTATEALPIKALTMARPSSLGSGSSWGKAVVGGASFASSFSSSVMSAGTPSKSGVER
jgi:hypothetical protein